MEITRINESYTISDKTELGWRLNGNVNNEVSGNLNMNADVYNELGEYVGSMHYSKPLEGMVHVSVNVNEDKRDEFTNYVDTVIESVLAHFSE